MSTLFEVNPDDVADTTDDWYTPPWLFKAAGLVFDMDVAAPVDPGRRTCPARSYLTPVEDGLTHPWSGVVWMNPPYSKASPWVDRWASHPAGLALLLGVPRKWMGRLWHAADAVTMISLLQFGRPDGRMIDLKWPGILAARGPECVDALTRVAAADPYLAGAYHVRPSGGVSCPRGTSGGRS